MIFRSSFLPNFQRFFGGHILNSSHALEVLHEVMQSKATAPVSKGFAENARTLLCDKNGELIGIEHERMSLRKGVI